MSILCVLGLIFPQSAYIPLVIDMKKKFPLLLCLACAVCLLLFPKEAASGVREGLRLSGTAVIPALFPFMVLTRFLFSTVRFSCPTWLSKVMQRFFGVDGTIFPALLCSLLGGYPVGVSVLTEYYRAGRLTRQEAEQALLFCNNSGPGFFIAVVGAIVLQDAKSGLLLYAIHVCTALLCGRLFARKDMPKIRVKKVSEALLPPSQAFLNAVCGTCQVLLQVSGLICVFSVAFALLKNVLLPRFPLIEPYIPMISGLLELTGGIMSLSGSANAFILAAFFTSWGGLCVHLQAMSLWQPLGLHPKGYFFSKLLHGLMAALFAAAFTQRTAALFTASILTVVFCGLFPIISRKIGVEKSGAMLYNQSKR